MHLRTGGFLASLGLGCRWAFLKSWAALVTPILCNTYVLSFAKNHDLMPQTTSEVLGPLTMCHLQDIVQVKTIAMQYLVMQEFIPP